MIYGTGIDLLNISRMKHLTDNNKAFIKRVFTDFEKDYCLKKKNYAESFAARFSAKEAFMKALGTGCRDGINFQDIEVRNDDYGKPELVLYGDALEFCREHEIVGIHLSISHSKELATAIVILEKK